MLVNRIRKNKIWIAMLGMFLSLMVVSQNVQAASAIDEGADVSLQIEYKKDGVKIEGATFDIYKVAEISETVEFTKTEDFSEFMLDLEGIDQEKWIKRAKEAKDFVDSNKEIEPLATGKTDKEGILLIPDEDTEMTTGLYLVIGHACELNGKTYQSDPFFICLPNLNSSDEWVYDEVAMPKVTSKTPTEVPKDTKLPQTGMLKWPIPVLAGTGILFFMIGWAKRQKEEK